MKHHPIITKLVYAIGRERIIAKLHIMR